MSDEAVVSGRESAGRASEWLTGGQFGLRPRTWQALLAVTGVALLARVVLLGQRPMHFDEGRVAYWALRYAKTGHFEYRYIIHGPFVQHVDRWLFALLGANDFVARLPVALVGGLLPLSTVLYRDHLRESELVALATLFAINPILLYYSRFLRSDVLVATFAFVALGLVVRLHATRQPRYLHAATAAFALAFASKENAVVYLLAWGGAAALLVDTGLYRPRGGGSGLDRLRDGVRWLRADRDRTKALAKRWGGHGLATLPLFGALTLFFFAPRAGTAGGVGLWKTLTRPSMVPELLRTTGWDIARGLGYWFGGAVETRCFEDTVIAGYVCFLRRYLATMLQFGGSLTVLAVAGAVGERYGRADSRTLVTFATYWGAASVVGYPLGMDIWAAWPVTHALVPLAIPAAVALAWVGRAGVEGLAPDSSPDGQPVDVGSRSGWRDDERLLGADDDREFRQAATAALLVVLLVGYAGAMAVESSFLDASERDGSTDMVQYAQPSGDMRPGLRAMRAAVAGNEGLDVVYYGDRYYLADESAVALPPPRDPDAPQGTAGWYHRLPMPWYTEAFGAEVASAQTRDGLKALLERNPPVVVASVGVADTVARRVDGYRRYRYDLRAHVDGPGRRTSVVIFVRTGGNRR